jgi:hypothetical protein
MYQRVLDIPLVQEPVEVLREQREDVELQLVKYVDDHALLLAGRRGLHHRP